jgi:hypothetical protein
MTRVLLLAALTAFVLAHTLTFCILLKEVSTTVSFSNLIHQLLVKEAISFLRHIPDASAVDLPPNFDPDRDCADDKRHSSQVRGIFSLAQR